MKPLVYSLTVSTPVKLILLCIHLLFTYTIYAQDDTQPVAPDSVVRSLKDFRELEQYLSEVDSYAEYTMRQGIKLNREYFRSAVKWAQSTGDSLLYNRARYYEFQVLKRGNQIPEALELGSELLGDVNFQKDTIILYAILDISYLYMSTEQFNEVLELYPFYKRMYDEHREVKLKPRMLYDFDMGMTYYKLRNYTKAIEYFRNPNKSLELPHNTLAKSSALNNIGLCYKELGNWDSANFYFNKAITTISEGTLEAQHVTGYGLYFISIIESNKAEQFFVTGEWERALPFFLREYDLSKKYNEHHITASAAFKVARVYYLQGDIRHSLRYLDTSIQTAKRIERSDYLIDAYEMKSLCFSYLGEIDSTKKYHFLEEHIRDSIERRRIDLGYLTSSVKYEITKAQENLRSSKNEIEMEKEKSRAQLIGILSLLITAIALLIFYLRSSRTKRIISAQNSSIQTALAQKEILLKEVHHRVKNNLQVISSLLQLQVRKLGDPKYEEMVKEAKEQIASMSLVHEMLYKNDDVSRIELSYYLVDLTEHICLSRNNRNVQVKVDSEEIETSVARAIPLGLITTELVINSFKHAFSNDRSGDILIALSRSGQDLVTYTYSDSGPGLPEEFIENDSTGLGFRLIKMLVEEMDAEFVISSYTPLSIQIICKS